MSDAQTWTVLIGLLTASATAFAFIWRLTTQTLEARFGQIDSRFDAIDSRFDAIDHKFEAMDYRFDALDHKIDRVEGVLSTKIDDLGRRTSALEDDVQAITRHLFNGPEAA